MNNPAVDKQQTSEKTRHAYEEKVAQRLAIRFKDSPFAEISRTTGINSETVRRYMQGTSRIPAEFIAQMVMVYRIDANYTLLGKHVLPTAESIKLIPTEVLIDEFTRRYKLVEDYCVGEAYENAKSVMQKCDASEPTNSPISHDCAVKPF